MTMSEAEATAQSIIAQLSGEHRPNVGPQRFENKLDAAKNFSTYAENLRVLLDKTLHIKSRRESDLPEKISTLEQAREAMGIVKSETSNLLGAQAIIGELRSWYESSVFPKLNLLVTNGSESDAHTYTSLERQIRQLLDGIDKKINHHLKQYYRLSKQLEKIWKENLLPNATPVVVESKPRVLDQVTPGKGQTLAYRAMDALTRVKGIRLNWKPQNVAAAFPALVPISGLDMNQAIVESADVVSTDRFICDTALMNEQVLKALNTISKVFGTESVVDQLNRTCEEVISRSQSRETRTANREAPTGPELDGVSFTPLETFAISDEELNYFVTAANESQAGVGDETLFELDYSVGTSLQFLDANSQPLPLPSADASPEDIAAFKDKIAGLNIPPLADKTSTEAELALAKFIGESFLAGYINFAEVSDHSFGVVVNKTHSPAKVSFVWRANAPVTTPAGVFPAGTVFSIDVANTPGETEKVSWRTPTLNDQVIEDGVVAAWTVQELVEAVPSLAGSLPQEGTVLTLSAPTGQVLAVGPDNEQVNVPELMGNDSAIGGGSENPVGGATPVAAGPEQPQNFDDTTPPEDLQDPGFQEALSLMPEALQTEVLSDPARYTFSEELQGIVDQQTQAVWRPEMARGDKAIEAGWLNVVDTEVITVNRNGTDVQVVFRIAMNPGQTSTRDSLSAVPFSHMAFSDRFMGDMQSWLASLTEEEFARFSGKTFEIDIVAELEGTNGDGVVEITMMGPGYPLGGASTKEIDINTTLLSIYGAGAVGNINEDISASFLNGIIYIKNGSRGKVGNDTRSFTNTMDYFVTVSGNVIQSTPFQIN